MRKKISKTTKMKKEDLSSEKFFKEFIKRSAEENELTDKKIEEILYRRMDILKEKLKIYTGNNSSSVTEEEAESILNGIDYTIGLYLKSFEVEKIIRELQHEDLRSILKKGENLIKYKVEKSKILLRKIKSTQLKVNNYSYDDTIEYGLSVFFNKYNIFFKPQETPCSIDYQLPVDIMNYSGIEYMEKYLSIINFENEFCGKFENVKIIKLLKNYDKKYEELLINIFKLVLINSIGRIMCDKDLNEVSLNKNDIEQITYELKDISKEEMVLKFFYALEKCLEVLNIKNHKLLDYSRIIIEKEADYIYRNIKEYTLQNIFIISRVEYERESIKYVDSEKLKDSIFRKYTEEIRECINVKGKIDIINSKFKSLEDIVDMLECECLFKDEFYIYFKSMPEIQKVLLWKYINDKYIDNEDRKEWCVYFEKYILNLSKESQINIQTIMEKIEF